MKIRIAAVFAAAVLALPSLFSPLLLDDVVHRSMLREELPGIRWGPLELYDFIGGPMRSAATLRDAGFVPWFTADDLKIRFFRPLSSATIAADVYLFGDRVWPARVHSLAWFLVTLLIVSRLHARYLPVRPAALATLLFAVAGGHAMPISWIAARHTLVASTLALLAFWCHVRWRDDGWRAGRWLASVFVAMGLFAGELALGSVALMAAWELGWRRDSLRNRLRALMPAAGLSVAYLIVYGWADYGARSSAYTGFGEALGNPALVIRHFWILVADLATAVPSDLVSSGSMTAQMAMAALGIVAATAMAFVVRTERPARWLAVAVGLTVLPGTLATVGGRVLTIALFASTALVAIVLDRGVRVVRNRQRPFHTRAIAGLAVCALGLLHVGGASSVRVIVASDFARIASEEERQTDLVPPCPDVMVIVAASDAAISTYVPVRLRMRGRPPQRYHVLSLAPTDHRIDNTAAQSFELTSARGDGSRLLWERLFRSGPVPAGTHVELPGLDVTVLEDLAGAPTRVRFVFDERLDSSRMCFLEWKNNRLSLLPPLNAGDVVDIPHEPGPTGF